MFKLCSGVFVGILLCWCWCWCVGRKRRKRRRRRIVTWWLRGLDIRLFRVPSTEKRTQLEYVESTMLEDLQPSRCGERSRLDGLLWRTRQRGLGLFHRVSLPLPLENAVPPFTVTHPDLLSANTTSGECMLMSLNLLLSPTCGRQQRHMGILAFMLRSSAEPRGVTRGPWMHQSLIYRHFSSFLGWPTEAATDIYNLNTIAPCRKFVPVSRLQQAKK